MALSFPSFLPDGRHYLYQSTSDDPAVHGVYVGTLDASDRKRLIAAQSSAIRRAYEEALRRRPGLSGRVVVRLVIAGGRVESVEIASSSIRDSGLEAAILALARTWTFSATGRTTTTYPLDFGGR